MCGFCKNKDGSNKHLLYWQAEWFKRLEFKKFLLTWYHFFDRKAYWKWKKKQSSYINYRLLLEEDEGDEFDFGDIGDFFGKK